MERINLTQADESDVEEITELFYNTIQNINKNDYSQDEIDDWSSWRTDFDKWSDRIREQYFVIAQLDRTIVGFASLAKDGYLDFLFVHKDFQRQGIAFALLNELERKAVEQNNALIYSDVSITARGFFEKNGFKVEKKQLKKSRKKELINFRMAKALRTYD